MTAIDTFLNFVERNVMWINFSSMRFTDWLEIFIIAFLFYEIMAWCKKTRAWNLFKGIIIIMIFIMFAAIFQMTTILWLAGKLFNAGLIALVVVFQPELRNALEHLGRRKFLSSVFKFDSQETIRARETGNMVEEVSKACVEMGKVKTGALIVFERDTSLDEYIRTGIDVDSLVTRQMLINIFEKNTPLHDGAVIVRDNRIAAATCYLPLSDNMEISKELGTRHRAAIGMSEVSDSLTVVVSEETGKISVAQDRGLTRDISGEELTNMLNDFLRSEGENKKSPFKALKRRAKND